MCKTVLTYVFMNLDSRGLDIHRMASLSEMKCRKVVIEAGTTFSVVVFHSFVEAKRPFPLFMKAEDCKCFVYLYKKLFRFRLLLFSLQA